MYSLLFLYRKHAWVFTLRVKVERVETGLVVVVLRKCSGCSERRKLLIIVSEQFLDKLEVFPDFNVGVLILGRVLELLGTLHFFGVDQTVWNQLAVGEGVAQDLLELGVIEVEPSWVELVTGPDGLGWLKWRILYVVLVVVSGMVAFLRFVDCDILRVNMSHWDYLLAKVLQKL